MYLGPLYYDLFYHLTQDWYIHGLPQTWFRHVGPRSGPRPTAAGKSVCFQAPALLLGEVKNTSRSLEMGYIYTYINMFIYIIYIQYIYIYIYTLYIHQIFIYIHTYNIYIYSPSLSLSVWRSFIANYIPQNSHRPFPIGLRR